MIAQQIERIESEKERKKVKSEHKIRGFLGEWQSERPHNDYDVWVISMIEFEMMHLM